jgi:hypothetical protein
MKMSRAAFLMRSSYAFLLALLMTIGCGREPARSAGELSTIDETADGERAAADCRKASAPGVS